MLRKKISGFVAALVLSVAAHLNGSALAQTAGSRATGDGAPVTVTSPWARATPGGVKVGGAFLTITGHGHADTLIRARSPRATSVELHTHLHDAGVMRMRRVDEIPIPASGNVKMQPGGYHIMLIDLKKPLTEGETIPLILEFKRSGRLPSRCPF
ncbi:MAG: copper chaperone PCu(A)C [Hyphomicrobiaceae bacterium]